MKNIFSQVQQTRIRSNTFDLSHDRKQSMELGTLTPILCMECVPGDRFNMSTSQMLRFAPMVAPVMHKVNVYTHFFFVPNRILWKNWEKFITGGEDGMDTSVFPTIDIGSPATGGLSDYLGIPTGIGGHTMTISVLPYAGYQKIYNEYYRDQNLQTKVDTSLVDGANTINAVALATLRTRAWQHDYFTSALPFTQKGPEATIPLGSSANIVYTPGTAGTPLQSTQLYDLAGNNPALGGDDNTQILATTGKWGMSTGGTFLSADVSDGLSADLSTATAASINSLRNAFRLQEWLERNARGGSRYRETIKSQFDVNFNDARVQVPEFLGGGSTPVVISEVLQTSSAATEPTPQGNMAGHGIAVGANSSFSYFCEEWGYVIGIMSVMPKTSYQQGIPKHFLKFDKFDYFWDSFAHLGEQPIQNKEIYTDPDGLDDDTFGYTPRYAEYKYLNSSVHGEFRNTLDFWQWSRKFTTRPFLNTQFIQCVPDNRIFAVLTGEKLYVHIHHRISANRKMPFFGTPRI